MVFSLVLSIQKARVSELVKERTIERLKSAEGGAAVETAVDLHNKALRLVLEIIAQPGPLRFKLKLPADAGIHDTFHVARLKPYTDPALVRHGTRPLASEYRRNPDDISDEEHYEVEGILDHDTRYGKRWYLIHWKGYDEVTQSTWEKREALTTSAKKILADYEKKHPILKGELARKKRRKKT